jgi:hypothetical protein
MTTTMTTTMTTATTKTTTTKEWVRGNSSRGGEALVGCCVCQRRFNATTYFSFCYFFVADNPPPHTIRPSRVSSPTDADFYLIVVSAAT